MEYYEFDLKNEIKNIELLKNSHNPSKVKFIHDYKCSRWMNLDLDSIPLIIKELKALEIKLRRN